MIKIKKLILLLILCAVHFSVVAAENEPPIQDTLSLETISITAQKNGRNLERAPIASSVLSGRELEVARVTTIKDFASAIPNLYMPSYGTKLTSPVYIRGIGSRINSPSVGLYVDGIPYFEKSSFDFDLYEVSSIEVLRGPQGTLYGRNTMGGIISVTTKNPLSYSGTALNLDYGSRNSVRVSASHYGDLSPYWGIGVGVNYEHCDGFFENMCLGDFADKLNSGGGDLKLRYRQGSVDLLLSSGTEYSLQNGYPYMMLDKVSGEPMAVNYNSPSCYNRLMSSNGALLRVNTPEVTLTSRTSYQYISDEQGIDQDFSPESLYYITQKERHNIISEDFQVSSRGTHLVDWLGGLWGFYQSTKSSVEMDYFESEIHSLKLYDTPRYGGALYAQGVVHLAKFDITGGLRYDIEGATMDYKYYQVNPTNYNSFKSPLFSDQLTPKVAVQYNFTKDRMVYGTITKGFKAGGFNTSFVTDEERTFDPESSWNYEVGGKFSFLDGALKSDVAFFYIDWLSQQIYQPLSTGTGSLLRNAGRSYSTGVEISLSARLFDGLNLRGDYGYTLAKFIDYRVGDNVDYSGNYIPYAPNNTFSLLADYTLPLKNDFDLVFACQYSGAGKIYFNDSNTNYQDFYTTLNARVSLSKPWGSVSLWARNLTSTKYYAFYFEALGNSYVQLSQPFTCGVELSIKL